MSEPDTPHLSTSESGARSDGDETHAGGMIRSEEELLITTELVETGRARLIKRVETETVTRTIELRREVLYIERIDPEPAAPDPDGSGETVPSSIEARAVQQAGPLAAGSFEAGSVEIVLMQEEAIITTQLVPRERVRLIKQIVTEERTVDADLQVEHVDLAQRPAARSSNPKPTTATSTRPEFR